LFETRQGVLVLIERGRRRAQLLSRNVKRYRGGLVFKAQTFVSLKSRLESNKEKKKKKNKSGLKLAPFFGWQR